jgi:hypothetical protein
MVSVSGEIRKLIKGEKGTCAFCDRVFNEGDIVVIANGKYFCSGSCLSWWYWS